MLFAGRHWVTVRISAAVAGVWCLMRHAVWLMRRRGELHASWKPVGTLDIVGFWNAAQVVAAAMAHLPFPPFHDYSPLSVTEFGNCKAAGVPLESIQRLFQRCGWATADCRQWFNSNHHLHATPTEASLTGCHHQLLWRVPFLTQLFKRVLTLHRPPKALVSFPNLILMPKVLGFNSWIHQRRVTETWFRFFWFDMNRFVAGRFSSA